VKAQGKLFVSEGPLCPRCPWRKDCGAMFGDKACRARWKSRTCGGRQALHPAFRITAEFLASVGGPGFESVAAQPLGVPPLPQYISLIRMRRDLRRQLRNSVYGISAGEVIGMRSKPLSAQAVRDLVGLEPDQLLVLLLFGKDKFLERLWTDRHRFLPELACGGFDLIVAPSYSLWEPRPRPEHLYALKRTLLVFKTLQELGSPVIPRVAWSVDSDAERLASWVTDNPALSHVGIDLTTYGGARAYAGQLELLKRFDRRSGTQLSYLVNGPSRLDRIQALYEAVSPERIHIANSRAIARDSAPGTSFLEKEETEERVVSVARGAFSKIAAQGKQGAQCLSGSASVQESP
jgi:Domain of unknown function (DUF4417)